jgi:nucleoside phosphorylase
MSLPPLGKLPLTAGPTSDVELKRRQPATVANTVEASKRLAAYTAVDRHVLPQHKVDLVLESLDVLAILTLIHLLDNRYRIRSVALSGAAGGTSSVRD